MSAYAGLRIVDCSQGLAGPMAAMLLGDFEAEVVKVEPQGGDRLKDHPGYLAWNRNKTIVTLGHSDPALRELIAGADVAIFDHAPGVLETLGLDAATLTAAHPQLIHAWMPPYGTSGRWSQLPAHHSLLTALTGLAFRQSAYDVNRPVHLILPLARYGQAVMGAAAIGAALYERGRSGLGQGVVVSGLHGVSEVSGPVRHLAVPPLPRGQPLGASPSYKLYQCGCGGWMFLATLFQPFYRKAVETVGLGRHWEEFLMDPLLAKETLKAVFLTRPRTEWLQLLQDNAVPCAPTGPREAWFQGDPVADGELRLTFDHPELGPVQMPAPPIRLAATPASVRGFGKPGPLPAWPKRPAEAGQGGTDAPLAGVRVLDLGTVIAGAYAGGVLANLGADVIKIEPPEGDPFRSDGAGFMAYSRGKRGLGLDLKQPAARELFFEMAREADVVLDNYRLGVRERLGIDYAALKAVNPNIISCSITAYGDKGPRAPMPGFDPLLQAEGGMMQAQGGEGEPILHTIPVNDVATAVTVAFGIITALNVRNRTGEGQEIRTSLMAQSLGFQLGEMVSYEGRPPNDLGDRDCVGVRALHRFYECADGWLALVCDTAEEASGVLAVTGVTDDPADALRAPRDGDLAQALEAVFAGLARDAAVEALLAEGVPAAPCIRAAEAWQSEWLWEHAFFDPWIHPRLGPMITVRGFADFSRGPGGFTRPTPDLGEHSRELLEEMGLAPERIAALFERGAVFEPGMFDHTAKSAAMTAAAGL